MAKKSLNKNWLNKYQSGTTNAEPTGPANYTMFNTNPNDNFNSFTDHNTIIQRQKAKLNYNDSHNEDVQPLTDYEIAIANQKNNPFYVTHNIGVRQDLSPEEFQYRAITNPASLGVYTNNPNPSQQQMMQSLNNTPFGVFVENPYEAAALDAGYRNNVIWGGKNLDINDEGASTWTNLVEAPAGYPLSMYNKTSKDYKYPSVYFIDPHINESNVDSKTWFDYVSGLSPQEQEEQKQRMNPYNNLSSHEIDAMQENNEGQVLKNKGFVANDVLRDKTLYRVLGNAGVDLKGALDFTPEMYDYITKNNLSDDDAKKYLLKQAGVNVDNKEQMDKILMHLNNFPIREYINQNYNRPQVTEPQKKKLGGRLSKYQSGTTEVVTAADVNDNEYSIPQKPMENRSIVETAYLNDNNSNDDEIIARTNQYRQNRINLFNQHGENKTPLSAYEIALAAQRNNPFYITHNVGVRQDLSPEEFKYRAITNPASLGVYVNNPSATTAEVSGAIKDTPFGQFIENFYSNGSSLDQGYLAHNIWANKNVVDRDNKESVMDSTFMDLITRTEPFYGDKYPSLYFIKPNFNKSNQAPAGTFGAMRNTQPYATVRTTNYGNDTPGDYLIGQELAQKGYLGELMFPKSKRDKSDNLYRLYTNKGVDLKGGLNFTNEMYDYIQNNNLSDEETKKYLMQQAGIDTSKMTKEEMDQILMHLNNTSTQDYVNQNFPRPAVTNPTEEKKKYGGWLNRYEPGGDVEPIVVNSKKDPRYKAYQDSLNAYNENKEWANFVKDMPNKRYTYGEINDMLEDLPLQYVSKSEYGSPQESYSKRVEIDPIRQEIINNIGLLLNPDNAGGSMVMNQAAEVPVFNSPKPVREVLIAGTEPAESYENKKNAAAIASSNTAKRTIQKAFGFTTPETTSSPSLTKGNIYKTQYGEYEIINSPTPGSTVKLKNKKTGEESEVSYRDVATHIYNKDASVSASAQQKTPASAVKKTTTTTTVTPTEKTQTTTTTASTATPSGTTQVVKKTTAPFKPKTGGFYAQDGTYWRFDEKGNLVQAAKNTNQGYKYGGKTWLDKYK